MQEFRQPIVEGSYIGINDTDPSQILTPGYFTKVDNAFVSDNMIKKTPGSSAIAATIASQNINGLAPFEKISSASKLIIANIDGVSNAQLYKWAGSGSFSAIGSANLTNSIVMNFETAADSLVGFNGTEVIDYDGTTVTKNRATIPLGTFPKWFHNYLFVAKTTSQPNRLFWSDLGLPTTFTAANFVDINAGDGDQCQGLGVLQDELFFFKQNTIWSITGYSGSSFSATTIAGQNTNARLIGYGCVAPQSIVSTGNDIYFLSYLGSAPVIRSLRKTQLATTLGGGIISREIQGTMGTINTSKMSIASGTFDGRYVYFSVPTGSSTVNNTILVLDTWNTPYNRKTRRSGYSWTTMSTKPAGHMIISTISGNSIPYFSDSAATGLVFKFDSSVYTDNGVAEVMDVRTRDFMINPAMKTKWKYMYLKFATGSAGTVKINARVDQAVAFAIQKSLSLQGNSPGLGPTGTFTLGVSVLGGSLTSKTRITFAQLTGTLLGLQFLESTANSATLYEHEIYGYEKGLRDD